MDDDDDLVIDITFLNDDDDVDDQFNEDDAQQERLSRYDIHDDNVKLKQLQPAWFMSASMISDACPADGGTGRRRSKAVQAQLLAQVDYLYARGGRSQVQQCVELIERLLRLSKPLPTTLSLLYDLMARCLMQLDRVAEAIPFLEKLLALSRVNIEAYTMLAEAYLRTEQAPECFDTFCHLLRLSGTCPEIWQSLANALSHFGYEKWAGMASQKCIVYCESLRDRYNSARFSIPFYESVRDQALSRNPICRDQAADHTLPEHLLHYLQNNDPRDTIPDSDEFILDAITE